MKTCLLTGLLIALFSTQSFTQDSTRMQYRISTTVTQYLFLDFPVTIEKVVGRRTLGLTLAFRPSTRKSGETFGGKGFAGDYEKQNFWNYRYNAATIGLNSKYFGKRKGTYVDMQLFYRLWWFNNKYSVYKNAEGYSFAGIRTERQHVIALKLLFGQSYSLKAKRIPLIDVYYGLGIRYKAYDFDTFNGIVNDQSYAYKSDRQKMMTPSFHLGANLVFGNWK